MASNRIERTNGDVQRVLAAALSTVKDPRLQSAMLSIVRVETTPDLRYAKVYISALGETPEKELMKGLRSASGYLRRELGHRLNLRYTPELHFYLDHSIAHGARIAQLLEEVEREDGEREDEHGDHDS